jgi:hypothetical protein
MTKRKETGARRQERIQQEQHRPEQNRGYDDVVKQGGPVLPNDTDTVSNLPPEPPDTRSTREQRDIDEQATERAIADVRRHERSAD